MVASATQVTARGIRSPSKVTFSPGTMSTSSSSGSYPGCRTPTVCGPSSSRSRWKTPSYSFTTPTKYPSTYTSANRGRTFRRRKPVYSCASLRA